jgi:outer membrane receptor for ferrienterochelin and colicin
MSQNGKESNIKITSKTLREFQMGLQFLLMEKRAKELDKLDPNLIESMNVLKGNALEKYGEDGANGVIEIITKKNKPLKSASKKIKQN